MRRFLTALVVPIILLTGCGSDSDVQAASNGPQTTTSHSRDGATTTSVQSAPAVDGVPVADDGRLCAAWATVNQRLERLSDEDTSDPAVEREFLQIVASGYQELIVPAVPAALAAQAFENVQTLAAAAQGDQTAKDASANMFFAPPRKDPSGEYLSTWPGQLSAWLGAPCGPKPLSGKSDVEPFTSIATDIN